MRGKDKYWDKRLNSPLPELHEDERIYLVVPYIQRSFAKTCHCRFDGDSKLWYTGCYNYNLDALLNCYDIHERTSNKARKLIDIALNEPDREKLYKRIKENA